ncbi:hypothetical protein BDZ89DRAFT_1060507 [Hymenopellis radicata]|nr:hypothetical protein BDZ89DRAFT_1060507 [Hymenopellis radicata]
MDKLDKDAVRKPPNTPHILKPHHIVLCTIITLIYPNSKIHTPSFMLHMLRLLLNEISEVAEPKPWKQLMKEMTSGPKSPEGEKLIHAFKTKHMELYSPEKLGGYIHSSLPPLFLDKPDDEPSTINRRSIFGYFLRRCFLSYAKLSWAGISQLSRDYNAWCMGERLQQDYKKIVDDPLSLSNRVLFRTEGDNASWAKPDSYDVWQRAHATGEEILATEHARKYFEQRFHAGNDSGLRQNALLNLVRMHYLRNEYDAARKILLEAVQVSRIAGDKVVLQHCTTMLNRLPDPERRPPLNEIQPHIHPLEILFDVKKLLEIENEQPLSASFVKIIEAMGLYDRWTETHPDPDNEPVQWAQHAVQAVVWHAAGCDRLADIEESIVIAFTEQGSSDNNRLTSILNKAYKQARQGLYSEALAALLEPNVWRRLTLTDYHIWAEEIWHILALRAARRGQDRLFDTLKARKPTGDFKPRHYTLYGKSPDLSKIDEALYEVIRMKDCDQPTSSLQPLLTALWYSEFLLRLNLYRTSAILLADMGIEFGLTNRSRKIIDDILPQIINGDDLEQRALACFVLARGIIASCNKSPEALRHAIPYLHRAHEDFELLEMYRAAADVEYLLALCYHNVHLNGPRDEAALKHKATVEKRAALEAIEFDDETSQVLDLVEEVGVKLASR